VAYPFNVDCDLVRSIYTEWICHDRSYSPSSVTARIRDLRPVEALLRQGARDLIDKVVKAELDTYLAQ